MKAFTLFLFVCCLTLPGITQNLVSKYQTGTVKLIADTTFAVDNDWDSVFESYNDRMNGKHIGARKSLKVLPDGSIVVSHAYKDFYTLFSPEGEFVKEVKVVNDMGVAFKRVNAIEGIINNNTLFTGLDNMGQSLCFDVKGNYKKTLKMDYATRQMIALPNGKIAVVGWVIWSDKFREFVAIVDYETNQEKIIWDYFTPRNCEGKEHRLFNYSYFFKERGGYSINTMPYTSKLGMASPPIIAWVKDKLIVANPTNSELLTFDLNGNKIGSEKMDLDRNQISVEEQKVIQLAAIEKLDNMNNPQFASWVTDEENRKAHAFFINAMRADLEKIKDPIDLPYFSTVIKDSDDNLLFFEFAEEEGQNRFNIWVYNSSGKFVGQSRFVSDEFQLDINPSRMVFHKGYIYGLQQEKGAVGIPLRLVRFLVTSE